MVMKKESPPAPFPPEKILVLGAGRFGRIAGERLSKRHGRASFLVIDSNEENLAKVEQELSLPTRLETAQSFLASSRIPDDAWIIPAIPIHVAFEWIAIRLERERSVEYLEVPKLTDQKVPNPFRMDNQALYTSYADFRCPDSCNEPDEICTSTGKPRPGNLFEHLRRIEVPGFTMTVVRSWQLAPGVGGYPASSLSTAFDAISSKPGSHLIATSCRCHGVVNALKWQARTG